MFFQKPASTPGRITLYAVFPAAPVSSPVPPAKVAAPHSCMVQTATAESSFCAAIDATLILVRSFFQLFHQVYQPVGTSGQQRAGYHQLLADERQYGNKSVILAGRPKF
jgi:hypothetical protein